ncbi:hypothetical protein [Novipirellula artificiosorum]|uniref:Uncharacterized protein n=1 Tax=Novipirellula artificiosorum TaxID=2528016 RepID=A0A5C6DWT1_9BACT|nr:hypothetical protein [Novipirellula artificiosorum]TWU39269.1 hypothetical protein Poly41_20920 [Novipirellula artificiosorum]
MDITAVWIGLLYGVFSAMLCYVVAMMTSGLFARSFYRLYARELIAICSVMLSAPGLRWLANTNPHLASIALTLAQFAVAGILGYGVFRFNRDYMKGVFIGRSTAAYFTFGTLANAAVVTLTFLHLSVTRAPNWQDQVSGFVGVWHYGPLLMLLAAMVFHTDYSLKRAVGDLRKFSRFTFVGYAISFLGLAFSVVPYLVNSHTFTPLAGQQSPLLQNFFCSQTLVIAIAVYAWLVWRYESIPPLFVLLLSIMGLYHVLVTQWVVRSCGVASWAIASLPLYGGLATMSQFFGQWDDRKQKSIERSGVESVAMRFAIPFRFVEVALLVAVFSITLWVRMSGLDSDGAIWLAATFAIYACFFFGMAIVRKQPHWIYISWILAGSAVLAGPLPYTEPMSVAMLASLALAGAGMACAGHIRGLKCAWRTPLTDGGFLSAILVCIIVLVRHVSGHPAYHFAPVGTLDAVALTVSALAFAATAYQYRSWLPVFGVLVALAIAVPPWSAAVGLFATVVAAFLSNRLSSENVLALENRVRFVGKYRMPMEDVLPGLYASPLSMGAIPLSLIGLLISLMHVMQDNYDFSILLGAAISAIVLGILTRTYRLPWLYIVSILAGYFAVHASAHGYLLRGLPNDDAVSVHLCIDAAISLAGWIAATGYATWCGFLFRRVHEDQEAAVIRRRDYYSGILLDLTCIIAIATFVITVLFWIAGDGKPGLLAISAALTALLFAGAGRVYRTRLGSYLALASFTVSVMNVLVLFEYSLPQIALAVAGMGLVASAYSCVAWRISVGDSELDSGSPDQWKPAIRLLERDATGLWLRPLAMYALLTCVAAVLVALQSDFSRGERFVLSDMTPITLAMCSVAFLMSTRAFRRPITYITSIALGYASVHALGVLAVQAGRIHVTPAPMHLAIAAAASLVGCLLAALLVVAINRRNRHALDTDRLIDNREYYAGILLHFSSGVIGALLLGLAALVATCDWSQTQELHLMLWVSVLLTAAFSLSGLIYRSRLQTYLAIAAACLGLYTVVAVWVPEAYRETYQTFALSVTGLLLVAIAKRIEGRAIRTTDLASPRPRRLECWQQSVLPLVPQHESLWSWPLAHVSVLLSFFTLLFVGQDWIGHPEQRHRTWLQVLPIFFVAASLWVASLTEAFRFVSRGLLVERHRDDADSRFGQGIVERGLLYVSSLIVAAAGVHMTVHLLQLQTFAWPAVFHWHLLVTMLIATTAWAAASLYTKRCVEGMPTSKDPQRLKANQMIYGGSVYSTSTFAAGLVLFGVCWFGIPPHEVSLPLFGVITLLVVLFALASATYRSEFLCRVSLLTLGLGMLHAALAAMRWMPEMGWLDPVLITLLSVVLMLASQRYRKHNSGLWTRPLCDVSIFYAVVGLVLIGVRPLLGGSPDHTAILAMMTCMLAVCTFALAALAYRTPLLTYLSVGIFTLSTIPMLRIADQPLTQWSVALSAAALVLGFIALAVEQMERRSSAVLRESRVGVLSQLYQRPLIRCSAVLAPLAIVHCLAIAVQHGWDVAQTPLIASCALGATTLMLNARSLIALHRDTFARLLVYLGAFAIAGFTLALASLLGGSAAVGLTAAMTALGMISSGLWLLERSRSASDTTTERTGYRLSFGQPLSHVGPGLSFVAIGIALGSVLVSLMAGPGARGLVETFTSLDWALLRPTAVTILIAAAVSLLAVRAQSKILWLYSAVALAIVGLCLLGKTQFHGSVALAVIGALMLLNAIVVVARVVHRQHASVASLLRVAQDDSTRLTCARPLFEIPALFTAVLLLVQLTYLAWLLLGNQALAFSWPWLWAGLFSGGLFFHVMYLRPRSEYVHLLVISSVTGIIGTVMSYHSLLTVDVALSVLGIAWGTVAFVIDRPLGRRLAIGFRLSWSSQHRCRAERHLVGWSAGLIAGSLAFAVSNAVGLLSGEANMTTTLLLATFATAIGAFRWRTASAATLSAVLLLLSLASAAFRYGDVDALYQYASLIVAVITVVYFGASQIMSRMATTDRDDRFYGDVAQSLSKMASLFSAVAMFAAIGAIAKPYAAAPIAISLGVVNLLWAWKAWVSHREAYAYASLIGGLFTVAYTCNTLLHLRLVQDSLAAFMVICGCFVLYAVNILASRSSRGGLRTFIQPTYYIALTLPLLLLVSIPLHQRAVAAFVLLAAGSFYLVIAHQSHMRWTMYAAAACVNVAIYLWVPVARQWTGLYQLYVIPAAITVLIFAELHRRDLKPSVLSSIRLAASGAILAVSTSEVFLTQDPGLLQFVFVLGFSLLGIAAGIALRVKPFVSVGLAFLVINVVSQLGLQFHQEGGIIRAVILIGVGLVVLIAMIFFNIHRERILARYRGFMLDEHWQ